MPAATGKASKRLRGSFATTGSTRSAVNMATPQCSPHTTATMPPKPFSSTFCAAQVSQDSMAYCLFRGMWYGRCSPLAATTSKPMPAATASAMSRMSPMHHSSIAATRSATRCFPSSARYNPLPTRQYPLPSPTFSRSNSSIPPSSNPSVAS